MARLALAFLSIFVINASAICASITYEVRDEGIIFYISFDKGYSDFDVIITPDNKAVLSFQTNEQLLFDRQDFFDIPVKSAYLSESGYRKRLFIEFDGAVQKPYLERSYNSIAASFAYPVSVTDNTFVTPEYADGGNVYSRMITGLGITLFFILITYWLMKKFFKRSIITDIPGSGRLIGKVDLELRKSLYFYEIGSKIYILGVSDTSINTVDIVEDEAETALIKGGFASRGDFSSYLRFGGDANSLKDGIGYTSSVVKEKLKSLKIR